MMTATGIKQRLSKAGEDLSAWCPGVEIEKTMYPPFQSVQVRIHGGYGHYTISQNGKTEYFSNLICPVKDFAEMVNEILQEAKIRVASMKKFLEVALDDKMPGIMLETLAGNPQDLRIHFCREVFQAVMTKLGKVQLPYPTMSTEKLEISSPILNDSPIMLQLICREDVVGLYADTTQLGGLSDPAPHIYFQKALVIYANLAIVFQWLEGIKKEFQAIWDMRQGNG